MKTDTTRSQHEMEIIKNVENARHYQDMMLSEGWKLFIDLKNDRIEKLKDQLIKSATDKETLWLMQIRLNGIIEFMNVLIEGMESAVECLNPQVLAEILKVSAADYEGEFGLPELPNE